MSASYLRYKNGVYHVRVRVPKDLKSYISRNEILKSLKTSDKSIAKLLARDYIYQINRRFVLLRTGYLDDQQKQQMVSTVVKPAYRDKSIALPTGSPTSRQPIKVVIYAKARNRHW